MDTDEGYRSLLLPSHLCVSVSICGKFSPRLLSASLRVLRGGSCVVLSVAGRLASVSRGTGTRRDGGERRRGRVVLRGLWLVGVYLCWGLVVTVLVAWGLAWGFQVDAGQLFSEARDFDRSPARYAAVKVEFGSTMVWVLSDSDHLGPKNWFEESEDTACIPGLARHLVPQGGPPPKAGAYAMRAEGWPWRALATECRHNARTQSVYSMPDLDDCPPTGALVIPGAARREYRLLSGFDLWLPLLPLWRGLIANTLFYTLLVWLLRRGFVRLRGWRRRRRGRCGWRGGSGYDLSGSVGTVCPECGRPVGEGSRGGAAGAAVG